MCLKPARCMANSADLSVCSASTLSTRLLCPNIYSIYGNIDLDKWGYQLNILLISRQKHMLWVLIRSGFYSLEVASNVYPQPVFIKKEEKYNYFLVKKRALSRAMD